MKLVKIRLKDPGNGHLGCPETVVSERGGNC